VAHANDRLLTTFTKVTLVVIITIIVAWSSILSLTYFGNANLITSVAAQQQQQQNSQEEEENLFSRGNEAAQQGRYEEAIEYLDRALAIDSDATKLSGEVDY
jgi:tetratricopeptide (TPR) repeat protein